MQRQPKNTKPKNNKARNGPVKKQKPQKSVTAPVSISLRRTGRRPDIRSAGRATTISHTEFISDISSPSGNFNATSFPINPGVSKTFPWLSNMAGNFESYLFKSLKFHYKPICPTSTPGVVSVAVDYDARDNSPPNKQVINSYEGTVSCSVWDHIDHVCAGNNLRKFGVQRYVRTSAAPNNTDIKTYDVGEVYIASSNTPITGVTTLGELWVSYVVDLYTPQLLATGVTNLNKKTSTSSAPAQAAVITSAAGVLSLAGEFLNDPLFAITKSFTSGAANFFDVAINPVLHGRDIFMTFKSITGTGEFRIGKPPNVVQAENGSLVVTQKSINGLWDWSAPNTDYYRQWILNVRPLSDNVGVNTWIPQMRFSMPLTGSVKMMASLFDSPPFPDLSPYSMLTLLPTVDPFAVDPTPWSIIANAAFALKGVNMGSFEQESFETKRDGNVVHSNVSTTPLNSRITEIADDYDRLSISDSIADNVRPKLYARREFFN